MYRVVWEHEATIDALGLTLIIRRLPLPEMVAILEQLGAFLEKTSGGSPEEPEISGQPEGGVRHGLSRLGTAFEAATHVADAAVALVIGWRGMRAGILREFFGIPVDSEDGTPAPDDFEVSFSAELLRRLILVDFGFCVLVARMLFDFVQSMAQRTTRIVEATAKN